MSEGKYKNIDQSNKDLLLGGAEFFGVEHDKEDTNKELKEKIKADGVTDDSWKKWQRDVEAAENKLAENSDADKDSSEDNSNVKSMSATLSSENDEFQISGDGTGDFPVVTESENEDEDEEDTILVKMDRRNNMMIIKGYKFTRDHPFVPVPESDAEFIISNYHGFKQALPSEAREYYS